MLQKELSQRTHEKNKLHLLAQLIMCKTQLEGEQNKKGISELHDLAQWKGSKQEGRAALLDKIQELVPSHSML